MAALQRRTESILNAVGEGIYGLDAEGAATFVNPAAERMTGWSAQETIGQQIHYMHHHSRLDGSPYPHDQCPIYHAISDGEVHHDVADEVFWHRDGTPFPVEYTSTPIYEGERLTGAVVVFKDISERKRTEAELLAAFREVERLKEQLQEQNSYLQAEIREDHNFGEIVGTSAPVQRMLRKIRQVADTDATVLVQGESGTGKELIAHAIHDHSPRRERPLIKVNCAAISAGLVESELFGHEKGAFTGALQERKGRFELADGGTLFLDEIGELAPETQVKLLRVLQEQEFERVGSGTPIRVDVRIIAATNRDLARTVAAGQFREDLFYRLNVFPIEAPPLRARNGDIPLLARHFLQRAARRFGKPLRGFRTGALEALQQYRWPGNIRELQNVIERAAILADGPSVDVSGLLPQTPAAERVDGALQSLETVERAHISRALAYCGGVIAGPKGAARILGLHPNTLRSRMLKLGIELAKE
ncbi:Fis family transcriptional regulator [Candidatus Tenderia electrophaga]|uniref:Fis family transcriptional regulator n=1 Tax=Candidatus Tenderia electrophaga TaxID=1748243 RepID=A0A0S2THZ3_9GAMM|nr:Fis family transcriptional regulator [Candidatus Tenderia electrophaga]